MSSISSVGSSSSNASAIYQERLAQQRAQKQAAPANKPAQNASPAKPAAAPAGDVDHDGDSH
jgi:hypothetical protein